ncbi:hypothetical protein IFM89_005521 [Coptis chinensis]|uniref:Epidermal patterning factor-like protein n=1 Tax=Coptis chinensis TaxID=261450 RepID=A0A835LYK4_9MAGN|nr:hypothetical protein IFM89_005521 [Coptis chinensis]
MWGAEEHRERRIWSLLAISLLQLMSWVSATSRPFAAHDAVYQQGQRPMFLPHSWNSKEGSASMERKIANEEAFKGLSTLGSRPPNCEHRCGGCVPCEAIQVPTTNDQLGVQYANYEPEGWRCKCGASVFSP